MSHGGLDDCRYLLQSIFHDPVFSYGHFGDKQIDFVVIITLLVIMIALMRPPSPRVS